MQDLSGGLDRRVSHAWLHGITLKVRCKGDTLRGRAVDIRRHIHLLAKRGRV
jgi:hypothetical protein